MMILSDSMIMLVMEDDPYPLSDGLDNGSCSDAEGSWKDEAITP